MRLVTFRRSPATRWRTESGFTLIELMLVVAIALIVGAFAMVNVVSAARSLRLNEATTDYANLLQKARIQAVTSDTYYTTRITAGGYNTLPRAYVDLKGSSTFAPGDPLLEFPSDVSPMTFASGPNLSNLESQFLPTGGAGTVNAAAAGPTFGPRGLPCTPTPGPGGTQTCPFLSATSFITFFQNSTTQKWAAVTVNPSARIRRWSYDGSSWKPLD